MQHSWKYQRNNLRLTKYLIDYVTKNIQAWFFNIWQKFHRNGRAHEEDDWVTFVAKLYKIELAYPLSNQSDETYICIPKAFFIYFIKIFQIDVAKIRTYMAKFNLCGSERQGSMAWLFRGLYISLIRPRAPQSKRGDSVKRTLNVLLWWMWQTVFIMISLLLLKTIKRSSCLLIGITTGLLNVACNSLPLGQTTRATSTSRDSLAVAARRCWNGVTSYMYAPLVTACPSTTTMRQPVNPV